MVYTMKSSKTYIAITPGVTIEEPLSDRDISIQNFATQMELSEKTVKRLVQGEINFIQDLANKLETVLGISAQFWNDLEKNYREKLALVEKENLMDAETARKRRIHVTVTVTP